MHQSILVVLSIVIIQLSYACFITNCPPGGKRSLLLNNNLHTRQCPRCGLNGQCYGSSVCCTDLGCRIGHPADIRQCSPENHIPIPCTINSAACSTVPNGRCASNGVCCSSDSCQVDESCSISSNQSADNLQDEST